MILVRTDASVAAGMGHAMRCLALVQAQRDAGAGEAVFAMAATPPAFGARLAEEGAALVGIRGEPGGREDAEETLAHARALGADWVVLDAYHLGSVHQRALTGGGLRVLALDDHGHAGRYDADLVLNPNLGADEAPYADRAARTRTLLGPRHALLRREFRCRDPAGRAPIPDVARRLLITLGGSDPADVGSRVLAALADVDVPLEVEVLVGAANPHREALERAAAEAGHPVELTLDARDVPERMARADLAIGAAGGSAWELACVGTPLIAIVIADNQRPAGRALAAGDLAVSLGWHGELESSAIALAVAALARDPARRAALSERGRALIDGQGAPRVLAAMGLL